MAWIESHQELADHPKLIDLCDRLQWEKYEAMGRLHCLWYWCVDYAEDGDLRKHNGARIAVAMGVEIKKSSELLKNLKKSHWIDSQPYLRIHDWWDYIGRFLQVKYKNYPSKWQRVRDLYPTNSKHMCLDRPLQPPLQPPLDSITLPNLTLPNQNTPKGVLGPAVNGHRSSAELVVFSKEHDRIEKRIKELKGTYSGHQTWSADDKSELSTLRVRMVELRKILGVTI